jgi:hypothetical protein
VAPEEETYCTRLNLQTPRVEDFVDSPGVKLFDLLVLAILEHGAPLSLEAAADRLVAAGVRSRTGDMVLSLKKSWHGMEPVYRDSEGRMGLNLSSSELDLRLFSPGLRQPRVQPVPQPQDPEPAPDDKPLTDSEVRWAFSDAPFYVVSNLRKVASMLDARNRPMSLGDLEACWSRLSANRLGVSEADVRRWRRSYVSFDEEGRLRLDRTDSRVPAMRRAIRKLARRSQIKEAHEQHWKRIFQERETRMAGQREQERREAARIRRAVLQVIPSDGSAAAAALLNVGERTVRTFIGEELFELRIALEAFDLVAALWVRETLHRVGVVDQDRFRLVDLKPPQKTRQLNRQGRKLSITPELLITSTTGISRPLGDPAKIAAYLASGSVTRLKRRIESDVKSLFAFYNYGVLHRCVRLRWGFLDEALPVDWAVPGDAHLYDTLKTCAAEGSAVELVWGSAPGWTDPWSRAHRVRIVSLEPWLVVVENDVDRWSLSRCDIQAARPAT